ncbi:calcium-binding allergen ole e 8-like protein [Chrysochromulina tobinii]|uniref:Calcium-binding allergen ole e 8-like protein n=1 Tax=Chrysochromulina tobinii TaxID=1460289 RepID=A0A0M0JAY4_9EUKA|nr:calcium-binding allergen ole e 8-like protein [Chrysochromulina tobinii]|eukprot:KOO23645.1 calcium-binding allergen ole e 8-like protein [Chrysochromulina sp. CCMP291]
MATIDRELLRLVFDKFDANASGRVSTAEMSAMLTEIDAKKTPEEIAKMMSDADRDDDGEINFEEFVAVVQKQTASGGDFANVFINAPGFFGFLNRNTKLDEAKERVELAAKEAAIRVAQETADFAAAASAAAASSAADGAIARAERDAKEHNADAAQKSRELEEQAATLKAEAEKQKQVLRKQQQKLEEQMLAVQAEKERREREAKEESERKEAEAKAKLLKLEKEKERERRRLAEELYKTQEQLLQANLTLNKDGVPVILDRYIENNPAGFELKYGTLDDFRGGLKVLLGADVPPPDQVLSGMEAEHTKRLDSDTPFEVYNYGTVTTSRYEFYFVIDPSGTRLNSLGIDQWPVDTKLKAAGRPCRQANSVRSFREIAYERLCQGNSYAATIHTINLALVKLSMLQKVQKVYRGLAGKLPKPFRVEDKYCARGGVELGFMSTTTNQHVAEEYASSAPGSLLLEIEQGLLDRGAEIAWLSEYPGEAEAGISRVALVPKETRTRDAILDVCLDIDLVNAGDTKSEREAVVAQLSDVLSVATEIIDGLAHAELAINPDEEQAEAEYWARLFFDRLFPIVDADMRAMVNVEKLAEIKSWTGTGGLRNALDAHAILKALSDFDLTAVSTARWKKVKNALGDVTTREAMMSSAPLAALFRWMKMQGLRAERVKTTKKEANAAADMAAAIAAKPDPDEDFT